MLSAVLEELRFDLNFLRSRRDWSPFRRRAYPVTRDWESLLSTAGSGSNPQAVAESWIGDAAPDLLPIPSVGRIVGQNANTPPGLSGNELFSAILQTADRGAGRTNPQRRSRARLRHSFRIIFSQLALNRETEPQVNAYALQRSTS